MPKTIEQMADEKQKRIAEAIKKKEFHWTKTELNINFSWAVNNANSFMPEKLRGTEEGFKFIEKWFPRFIELYRGWAIENIPLPETTKLTPQQNYMEVKAKAPESQAEQELSETLGEKTKAEEEEEPLPIIEE